jgi:hypothetical protein
MPVDLDALRRESRKLERGEATHQITSQGPVRISVGLRGSQTPDFFLEVVVSLCPDGSVNLENLGSCVKYLRHLESMGYGLECSDSVVCCEKTVSESNIDSELKQLREIMDIF